MNVTELEACKNMKTVWIRKKKDISQISIDGTFLLCYLFYDRTP
jgi:hypothetical protein